MLSIAAANDVTGVTRRRHRLLFLPILGMRVQAVFFAHDPRLVRFASVAFGSAEQQLAHPSMLALSVPTGNAISGTLERTGASGRKSPFSSYYDAPTSESAPTRWAGAPRQFGYGLLGILGGAAFGAAAGYGAGRLVGYLFLPDRPERSYEEPLYRINTLDRAANFGMAVGSVLGLTVGTGFMVTGTAQDNYVSPGFWTPTLGALGGDRCRGRGGGCRCDVVFGQQRLKRHGRRRRGGRLGRHSLRTFSGSRCRRSHLGACSHRCDDGAVDHPPWLGRHAAESSLLIADRRIKTENGIAIAVAMTGGSVRKLFGRPDHVCGDCRAAGSAPGAIRG